MQQQSGCSACRYFFFSMCGGFYMGNFVLHQDHLHGLPVTGGQRPLLIDRDRKEEDSLEDSQVVKNQSWGRDLTRTVQRVFSRLLKRPCIHSRREPNGYMGLYLFKVVHVIICEWRSDNMKAKDHTVTFFGGRGVSI